MMVIYSLLFLLFVHISLLIPGYVIIKKTNLLSRQPGIELVFSYLITIAILVLLSISGYILGIDRVILGVCGWLILAATTGLFVVNHYYRDVWRLRFPLACLLLMSTLSLSIIGLSFNTKYTYFPDPSFEAGRNYNTLNVKVLNIAHTQANDNYIPYRQAQFIINRSDPGRDSFIGEWGVHFFQRTPLMGAVTASYMNLLDSKLPIDYTWSSEGADPDNTYIKFQIISHVLNTLFILPAFFLLTKLFTKKIAVLTCLFLVPSQYFLFNSIFSWPKSLVAFFVLLSWLLLLEKQLKYTILAGIASGIAYLSHDLAVLYIGAAILLLLWNRRFRDLLIFGSITLLFVLPWVLVSSIVYKKPSSFILYPISTKGIPSPENKKQIIYDFLTTSPWELLKVRIDNLLYLLTPYQLISSEGGQDLGRRIWGLGIFSIPGSVGLGLLIPAFLGTVKRLRDLKYWILTLTPVVLAVVSTGWPHALGALHFAEPIVVLFSALGIMWLLQQKSHLWLIIAYVANIGQLVFFTVYSFEFSVASWLTNAGDILRLFTVFSIVCFCGWQVYLTYSEKRNPLVG